MQGDEIHPDGLPTPRRYFAMLAIAIGIAMAVLDGTVVNVALPSIARELGAKPSAAVWVDQRLPAGHRRLLLPLASIGERIGYRPGLSGRDRGLHPRLARLRPFGGPGRGLIAARVVQGVGGAAIMSMNGALVRHTYPDAHARPGIGLNGLVVGHRGGRGAVGCLRDPRGRRLAVALRGQRAVRPRQPVAGAALPATVGGIAPGRSRWTSAMMSAAMFALFFIGADGLDPRKRGWFRGAAIVLAVARRFCPGTARRGRMAAPLVPIDLFGESGLRLVDHRRRSAPSSLSPSPSWRCPSISRARSGSTRSRPGC